ncbi:MAG TPA: hypothetical protein GX707_12150 [Epulopiscium sp.]|nr:hypothetical protein [Candidatus Epulonipiscium sp.]
MKLNMFSVHEASQSFINEWRPSLPCIDNFIKLLPRPSYFKYTNFRLKFIWNTGAIVLEYSYNYKLVTKLKVLEKGVYQTMQKVIKRILLTTLAITTTLFIAGCSQVEGKASKEGANPIVEMPKENQKSKKIEADVISEKQPINIKEQMTQGLSDLEIVKIKTAFPLMLHAMEQGKEYNFEQIIIDLESMKNIVTFSPFKEDLEALQGLLQYSMDKSYV